jgi:hypothetical protein
MSTICLGMLLGLPHIGMAGLGCIYSPQHKTSHWRKAVLSTAHRTMQCSLSGVPSRWSDTAADHWHRIFTQDTPDVTPDSPIVFSPQCHLELAVGTTVPWCTGQSGAPDQTICRKHFLCFLDFT